MPSRSSPRTRASRSETTGDVRRDPRPDRARPIGSGAGSCCPADKSIAHRALIVNALSRRAGHGRGPLARRGRAEHRGLPPRARRADRRGAPSGRSCGSASAARRRGDASARLRQLRHDDAAPCRRPGRAPAARHARRRRLAPRAADGARGSAPARRRRRRHDDRRPRADDRSRGRRACGRPSIACRSPARSCSGAAALAALAADGETRIAAPGPTRDHTERMLAAAGRRHPPRRCS